MGIFTNSQTAAAADVFSSMKPYLKKKDGRTHVIMVNSFSKLGNQVFGCDDKYTTELNALLNFMQSEGYEIIDIKFNSISNQGMTGNRTGINTLITYK